MYESHEKKLNCIAEWAQQWVNEDASEIISLPLEERVETLMNAIRKTHYSGCSEWGNDYDYVERIVRRVLDA